MIRYTKKNSTYKTDNKDVRLVLDVRSSAEFNYPVPNKNFFCKNMRLENTHIEHTEVEERRKTFILDTAEDHEKNCFSDNVRQCNIRL